MPEDDRFRPTNYSLGDRATFKNTNAGFWIVSKATLNRPLEVIKKGIDQINFWDWEPRKLVHNFLLTSDEFDTGDYHHIVVRSSNVSSGQKNANPK